MSNAARHPSEEELFIVADCDFDPQPADRASMHVQQCATCLQEVEEHQATLQSLWEAHGRDKALQLRRPVQWQDLRSRMRQSEKSAPRTWSTASPWFAMAAAASLLIAVIAIWKRNETVVSAAELLDRAARTPMAAPRAGRTLRVKMRNLLYVRPAVSKSTSTDLTPVAALFDESGFDWNDPFSARAFANWRSKLTRKEDRVSIQTSANGRVYHIRTSTPEGRLAEASISLRASDLRPVREILQFRDAPSVEIEEATLPAGPPQNSPDVSPELPNQDGGLVLRSGVASTVGPSEELQVIAALHKLEADLGEPVEVRREGAEAVMVSTLGLAGEREQEIKKAVSVFPFVRIEAKFPEDSSLSPERSASRIVQGRSHEMDSWLQAKIGSQDQTQERAEAAIDSGELLLAHAHALGSLATRFPAEIAWTSPDQEVLNTIVRSHAAKTKELAARTRRALAPFLEPTSPQGAVAATRREWHAAAPALLKACRDLDRLITRAFASSWTGSPQALFEEIGVALSEVSKLTAELDGTVP